MSTRSSARNLFPPLDNLELTIRRRSRTDPTLLNDFEMAAERNGDPPVPDLWTMEELCQPSLNGQGGPIAPIAIQATNFRIKNNMIQQVQNSCQFHGLPGADANKHLDKFLHVTKASNESSSSITSSSDTEIAALKAEMAEINKNLMRVLQPLLAKLRTYMLREPTKVVPTNPKGASHGQNPPPAYQAPAYQALGYQAPVHQPHIPQPQVVTTNEFTNFMKANDYILKNMQTNMTSLTNSNLKLKYMFGQFMKMNTASSSGSRTLPSNTITNPKEELKDITTHSRTAYQGPTVPTSSSFLPPILARTPLNKHCSVVLFKKLPEKLGDPGKFLISYDFPRMAECLALADLGASINLMPLSVWNKLSLPKITPTLMTLELADRSISRSIGVVEDVYVKVGKFHFPADFVVVDFDADPRVPLILRRSFLKTGRALIDVFERELTLHVGKEAITLNLSQTSRYSANYDDITANRIDVLDMACEEYSQEVLGFSDMIAKVDAFLALEDDATSPEVDQSYFDPEGDILLLEAFLNDDPSLPPLNQENYLPQDRKELKICEAKTDKSSIDDPPEVELKDLPPHLEYAFLEGDDKLPVIIAKDLSAEEKTALITEVLKLLDAELIYPIFDSPWFNEATRKDHFHLPFMDQMLERQARNEYYCFLDGFSGYFQILIDPKDQEKITFTCLYEKFAYRHMPFGLCNAPGTFQRCMMAIFHNMIEKTMEVFVDDFSVFRNSFQTCLSHLERMLKLCEDTNLCLNWEKSHFMVKDSIVFGHKISRNGIEVDKAKVDVIAKLPHPTTIKGIRSFLGHAGFYRIFIKYFSNIARPMTHLLEKDTSFFFSKECVEAFQTLKRKLTEAPILIAPD
nr:reverse transcriptase domain-containing protein [Tanacetum cinerariifolium]